jgi:GNAT superfamily N-acetyltransferase
VGELPETGLHLLQPHELPALARLHEACFARVGDILSLLRQRYGAGGELGGLADGLAEVDLGPRSEVVVASTPDGQLVGAQAMTWLPAMRAGQPAVLGMMTLGMVHPDFRRRGLFRTLVTEAERVGWEGGTDVQFTMPNDRSAPAFARFETWQDGGRRRAYLLALDPGKMAGQRIGLGGLGAALGRPLRMAARWSRRTADGLREVTDLSRLAPAVDALARRVAEQSGQLTLLRNTAFARWRYSDCPIADYRFLVSEGADGTIDGLVVTTTQPRFGSTLGFVVDILSDAPPARLKLLLRLAVRSLWEQGATAAVCVGRMEGHRAALKGAGFIDVTAVYPRVFHTYYSLPPEAASSSAPEADPIPLRFDPATDWYLSLADFDSV